MIQNSCLLLLTLASLINLAAGRLSSIKDEVENHSKDAISDSKEWKGHGRFLNNVSIKGLMGGNSYTRPEISDSLQQMFEHDLGGSAVVDRCCGHGGWKIYTHANWFRNGGYSQLSEETAFLVLQDQSKVPSYGEEHIEKRASRNGTAYFRENMPPETDLILFMTWGRRYSFTDMQERLKNGYEWYRDYAIEQTGNQKVYIAPVGLAFKAIHDKYCIDGNCNAATDGSTNFTKLYGGDGSHQSRNGSYLAACVFYATITGKPPQGTTGLINQEDAVYYQEIAAKLVLEDTPDYDYSWRHQAPAPTKSPTNAPTQPPTPAPTKSPTNAPTQPPTPAPTKSPTNAPTQPTTPAPTKSPTNAPTQPTTLAPTKSPTNAPTRWGDVILEESFESTHIFSGGSVRWGNNYAYEGSRGYHITRFKQGGIAKSSGIDIMGYLIVKVEFYYLGFSGFDNTNQFDIQYRFHGSSSWSTPEGGHSLTAQHRIWEAGSVTFETNGNSLVFIRFRSTGHRTDNLYFDMITISGQLAPPSFAPTPPPIAPVAPTYAPTKSPANAPTQPVTPAPTKSVDDPFEIIFEETFEDEEYEMKNVGKKRVDSSENPTIGDYSLRLKKRHWIASFMKPIRGYSTLKIDFKFYGKGMEDEEYFILESKFNGSPWTAEEIWIKGGDFNNGDWKDASVLLEVGNKKKMMFRIKTFADQVNDQIFLDDIVLSGLP